MVIALSEDRGTRESLECLAEPILELAEADDVDMSLPEESPTSRVDSLAGVERAAVSERDPFASEPPSEPELCDSIRQALTEETPAPHATALPTPDEISIPPMGDLSSRTLEPIAERFFSEGEIVAAHLRDDDGEEDCGADKAQRKSLPHVVERRQRFARYVRWAVGSAAIVCLAALARTTVTMAPAVVAPVRAAAGPVAAVAVAAPTLAEPVAAPTPVEPPKVDVPKVEEHPEPAKTDAPAIDPKQVRADKTALQEKNDSRRALERGKLADAIEAGERSVALDPLDGEAWLLLGAAYQESGKNAEARRCYTACVTEGKRGPLGECRAMLH